MTQAAAVFRLRDSKICPDLLKCRVIVALTGRRRRVGARFDREDLLYDVVVGRTGVDEIDGEG